MQFQDPKIFLKDKNKEVFAFFIISRIFAIYAATVFIADVEIYQQYAKNIIEFKLTPYLDFDFFYQPLTLVPINLSAIFLSPIYYKEYLIVFSSMMLIFDFSCLAILRKYCLKRLHFDYGQTNYMALIYSLLGLFLFALIYHRLEMISAFLLIISLLALGNLKSNRCIFLFLGLFGVFYNLIFLAAIPLLWILWLFFISNKKIELLNKVLIKNLLIFISLFLVIMCFCDLIFSRKFLDSFINQQQRGIDIQSTFGSILLLFNTFFKANFDVYYAFNSFNINSGFLFFEILSKITLPFILLSFFSFLIHLKFKNKLKTKLDDKILIEGILTLLMIFASFSRVLTIEFLICLIPYLSIVLTYKNSKTFFISFVFIYVASSYLYNFNIMDLAAQDHLKVSILFLRNLLITILSILMIRSFFKQIICFK